MKKNKFALLSAILIVLAMVVSMLVACRSDKTPSSADDSDTADFTVKVVGLDGKPFTNVRVQPCLADGTVCFNIFKKVDENGTVTFNATEFDDGYSDATELEIHLADLPVFLTYEAPKVKKGNSVTITLKMNVGEVLGGRGTANYLAENPTRLDTENDEFSPYLVGSIPNGPIFDFGVYEFEFTSATQKIYFQFKGDEDLSKYVVYSVGDVDAQITWLQGSVEKGIFKQDDDKFHNDNISDSDANFRLEFYHNQTIIDEADSTTWFEITLSNSQHVNKTGYIVFEYVGDYE